MIAIKQKRAKALVAFALCVCAIGVNGRATFAQK